MTDTKKIILAGVAVLAVAGGGVWYMTSRPSSSTPTASDMHMTDAEHANMNHSDTSNVAVASIVTYNGSSFSVSTSKITSGNKIRITNNSKNSPLDFDSDPHPTHTDNPELNAGDIAPGESTVVTLTTKGTWGFHNHHDPTQHGTITVE